MTAVPIVVGQTAAGAASLPVTLAVVGHGWGHGRGMGQYGAYGYALAGKSYSWILAHYYGGTTEGSVGASTVVPVRLTELDGAHTVEVTDSKGNHTLTAGQPAYTPAGGVAWLHGSWPEGPTRPFEGQIQVLSSNQTLNLVPVETYVQGVVPAESPASWGVNGESALQAQAVAARSYALSYLRGSPTICDSTSCQVYVGDPNQPGDEGYSAYVHYSDTAQSSTAGRVRTWASPAPAGETAGAPALTEFSSSTGGWTAGGAFPPVVDAGDATPSNPNHDWRQSVPTSAVQAAYGWAVGTPQSITVTGRNGLGDLGGRVTQMVITGTAGRISISGAQFAGAVGLNSDWFAVTNAGGASGGVNGYWVVAANGGVYPFGGAVDYGSMVGRQLNAPVLGMAPTANGLGYWLVAADGGIFSFGNAHFYGSTGNTRLNRPVLGMTSSHDGRGYWLFAGDGGIFSFGDARFHGSTGNLRLNQPIVGMAATPDGGGYWLIAADGGIFSFGDARFHGSTGNIRLAQPVVGMVPTSNGGGYWLVARDGGIFAFGNAGFIGSLPGRGISDNIVSVTATGDGRGYLMVSVGGRVYTFGDAPYFGDPASSVAGWSSQALGVYAHKG
jgi:SpoIID/LytB domain protein